MMMGRIREALGLLAAVLGVSILAALPAEARSYSGRELGAWEGPVYVAKPKAKRAKAAFRKAVKRSGYADKASRKGKGKRYAAINRASDASPSGTRKSLSGGGVRWAAGSGCLSPSLKSVIYQVAANYGPVTVSSTCRSRGHNARVGGAKKSYHLTGSAADFRVHANSGAAYAFLRSNGSVGGLKHYGGGLFHIDTGPRRAF